MLSNSPLHLKTPVQLTISIFSMTVLDGGQNENIGATRRYKESLQSRFDARRCKTWLC